MRAGAAVANAVAFARGQSCWPCLPAAAAGSAQQVAMKFKATLSDRGLRVLERAFLPTLEKLGKRCQVGAAALPLRPHRAASRATAGAQKCTICKATSRQTWLSAFLAA